MLSISIYFIAAPKEVAEIAESYGQIINLLTTRTFQPEGIAKIADEWSRTGQLPTEITTELAIYRAKVPTDVLKRIDPYVKNLEALAKTTAAKRFENVCASASKGKVVDGRTNEQ